MKQYVVLFASGIATVQLLPALPSQAWLLPMAALALLCVFFRYWRLMSYVIGFLWVSLLAWDRLNERLDPVLEGKDLPVSGYIASLPRQTGNSLRFDFIPDRQSGRPALPSRIRLNWYQPPDDVSPGQYWQFTVRLKSARGLLNPGGFDYEQWLFKQNIGATGYIRNQSAAHLLSEKSPMFNIDDWRQGIIRQLAQQFGNSPMLGFVQALTIGERHLISATQWDVLRKTGTVHLLAISGLHIGMVSGLVYFVVLRLWACRAGAMLSPPSVAALAALLAGVFYAALAGFSLPTVRSISMLFLFMLAWVWRRNSQPLHILSIAFLAILISDPFAIFSASFCLSFFAVVIIFYVLAARRRKPGNSMAMIKINMAISIALTPFLVVFFQQVSLISPLANLIAVPVVSFIIVPLAFLATCIMQFDSVVAGLIFKLLDGSLQALYAVLSYLANLPLASIQLALAPIWTLPLAVAGVFIILMPKAMPGRILGPILCLPLLCYKVESMPAAVFKLTLLDVGQGLAVVLQTREHVLLYDAGARYSSQFDMGERVVLPFMRTQGVQQLDLFMLSHGDNDHSGGAAAVIDTLTIKKFSSSIPEFFNHASVETCRSGQSWVWDEVSFELLAPPAQGLGSDNDNSCVLKVSSLYGSVLLPGDVEKNAELWLIQHHAAQLKANVLIAPHHGSNSSSSLEFLRSVQPDTVLISAAYKNRFGHPHAEVCKRYQQSSMTMLNTAEEGAISVLFEAKGIQINSFRQHNSHYWNAVQQHTCKQESE